MGCNNLTIAISALATSIANKLCDEELILLACILSQLGDTLNTIAAQRELQKKCCEQFAGK